MGDFNSNKIWDRNHRDRNHTMVVNDLKKLGLESIYHDKLNENQDKESHATFYLYRLIELNILSPIKCKLHGQLIIDEINKK